MSIEPLATASLAFLLVASAISDLRRHRIPNPISLGGIALAFLLQSANHGADGALIALGGLSAGFLVFVVPYAFSATGAGDVKLMMMVGAFLGWTHTLNAAVATLFIGALMGVAVLAARGGLTAMASRYGTMLFALAAKRPTYLSPQPGEAASTRFPYALAIALGTLVALWRIDAFRFLTP